MHDGLSLRSEEDGGLLQPTAPDRSGKAWQHPFSVYRGPS
jgi:hypothetical protein